MSVAGRSHCDACVSSSPLNATYDLAMATAVLRDSNGLNALVFNVSAVGVQLTVRWTAQPVGGEAAPVSEIRFLIDMGRSALADLREDLQRHLHRPISEIAATPFSDNYDLHSPNGFVGLEFTDASGADRGLQRPIPSTLAGRGFAIVRCITARDNVEIALPIDVTVLDRFCSELGDLEL
jgi:hypothetical protein